MLDLWVGGFILVEMLTLDVQICTADICCHAREHDEIGVKLKSVMENVWCAVHTREFWGSRMTCDGMSPFSFC